MSRFAYLRSVSDLSLLLGAALMSAATALPASLPRAALILAPAILLPGCAVSRACLGRVSLDLGGRLALATVLSLAVYVLLALLLYVVGLPLRTPDVLIAADAVIVGCVAASLLQSRRAGTGTAGISSRASALPRPNKATLLGAAVLVSLCGVLWGSLRLLPGQPPPGRYTALELAAAWTHPDGVITVRAGAQTLIPVTIDNQNPRPISLSLSAALDAGRVGPAVLVRVRPGATGLATVGVTVPADRRTHRVFIAARGIGTSDTAGPLTVWVRAAGGGESHRHASGGGSHRHAAGGGGSHRRAVGGGGSHRR